jgi:purine-cytosine permease-like protein
MRGILSTLTSTPLTVPRYAWVPQLIVLSILAGTAGPKFDVMMQATGDGPTIAGNRHSFFSVCLSTAITYAPGSADLVYCHPELCSYRAFLLLIPLHARSWTRLGH